MEVYTLNDKIKVICENIISIVRRYLGYTILSLIPVLLSNVIFLLFEINPIVPLFALFVLSLPILFFALKSSRVDILLYSVAMIFTVTVGWIVNAMVSSIAFIILKISIELKSK